MRCTTRICFFFLILFFKNVGTVHREQFSLRSFSTIRSLCFCVRKPKYWPSNNYAVHKRDSKNKLMNFIFSLSLFLSSFPLTGKSPLCHNNAIVLHSIGCYLTNQHTTTPTAGGQQQNTNEQTNHANGITKTTRTSVVSSIQTRTCFRYSNECINKTHTGHTTIRLFTGFSVEKKKKKKIFYSTYFM